MKHHLYGLLAETNIHPGTGQDAGFVDLPVSREATTGYPVIVGSAAKGALRDQYVWSVYHAPSEAELQNKNPQEIAVLEKNAVANAEAQSVPIFGKSDEAGGVLVSDVRLLMLPVRSLTSSYVWITCPHLIERCCRDISRQQGGNMPCPEIAVEDGKYLAAEALGASLYLEERQFCRQGDFDQQVAILIKSFIVHEVTAKRVQKQLAIITDDDFAWFARFGLPIHARNSLHRERKTSLNLWYEEVIPADALFYMVLAERSPGTLTTLHTHLMNNRYLQVGGNETVGQGWFAIKHVVGGRP